MTEIKRLDVTSFQDELQSPASPISAFRFALQLHELFAEGECPSGKVSKRVDFLFHEFMASMPPFNDVLEGISALNDFLFRIKNYKVIAGQPVSPDQVFLGKVLEARCGGALSVSLIFREMVRKMNLGPADFVNFPGLSAVKVFFNHQLFILNPAEEGKLVSIAELQARLARRTGQGTALNGSYLETPSELQVISGILTKLKAIYFDQRDWIRLLAVLDLLVYANAGKLTELKERGLLLYQLGFYREAYEDLQFYVVHSHSSPEVDSLRKILTHLQKPQVTPVL